MKRFEGKVAIVTGGTRGIGLGVTKAFLEEGASVLAAYQSDEKAARAAIEALADTNGELRIYQADISDKSSTEQMAAEAVDRWGRVDALVNNAGVFDFGYLDEMTEEFLNRTLDVNLKGMIFAM